MYGNSTVSVQQTTFHGRCQLPREVVDLGFFTDVVVFDVAELPHNLIASV